MAQRTIRDRPSGLHADGPRTAGAARRQGRIRPLIVGDPLLKLHDEQCPQLPGARDEAEQVAGFFEASSSETGDLIDFDRKRDVKIHEPVTSADMRARLRDGDYDIVHFAGHGVFKSRDPETSAWILSDGELWSLEIRNTLVEHRAPPWLVYANACEAGMEPAARRGVTRATSSASRPRSSTRVSRHTSARSGPSKT